MNQRSRFRLATRVASVVFAGVAYAGHASAADKVRLRLDWVYGSEHAPIFLAIEKGYFAKEGIEVSLLPGEGSSVTVKLVGNRDADFGYAAADQALIAASRDLPVVSTAVILQRNPTALVFKKSENIHDIQKDLYGKTIGVQLKSTTARQWDAVKALNHLDASKFKEVPADGAIVPLISSNRIDVGVAFFFNDGLKLRATGEDVDWISFETLGVKMYSTALLTNASLIKENPDLVRRFTHAFVQGWTYSKQHPDEALAAFLKANPGTDAKYAELKLPEVLRMTEPADDKSPIGYSTLAAWNGLQDFLLQTGLQKDKISVEKVFTNDFLK